VTFFGSVANKGEYYLLAKVKAKLTTLMMGEVSWQKAEKLVKSRVREKKVPSQSAPVFGDDNHCLW